MCKFTTRFFLCGHWALDTRAESTILCRYAHDINLAQNKNKAPALCWPIADDYKDPKGKVIGRFEFETGDCGMPECEHSYTAPGLRRFAGDAEDRNTVRNVQEFLDCIYDKLQDALSRYRQTDIYWMTIIPDDTLRRFLSGLTNHSIKKALLDLISLIMKLVNDMSFLIEQEAPHCFFKQATSSAFQLLRQTHKKVQLFDSFIWELERRQPDIRAVCRIGAELGELVEDWSLYALPPRHDANPFSDVHEDEWSKHDDRNANYAPSLPYSASIYEDDEFDWPIDDDFLTSYPGYNPTPVRQDPSLSSFASPASPISPEDVLMCDYEKEDAPAYSDLESSCDGFFECLADTAIDCGMYDSDSNYSADDERSEYDTADEDEDEDDGGVIITSYLHYEPDPLSRGGTTPYNWNPNDSNLRMAEPSTPWCSDSDCSGCENFDKDTQKDSDCSLSSASMDLETEEESGAEDTEDYCSPILAPHSPSQPLLIYDAERSDDEVVNSSHPSFDSHSSPRSVSGWFKCWSSHTASPIAQSLQQICEDCRQCASPEVMTAEEAARCPNSMPQVPTKHPRDLFGYRVQHHSTYEMYPASELMSEEDEIEGADNDWIYQHRHPIFSPRFSVFPVTNLHPLDLEAGNGVLFAR